MKCSLVYYSVYCSVEPEVGSDGGLVQNYTIGICFPVYYRGSNSVTILFCSLYIYRGQRVCVTTLTTVCIYTGEQIV